jgi:hypothetical protein
VVRRGYKAVEFIRFIRRGTHRGAGIMPIQTPDRFMQANNIFSIGVAKTGVTIDS